MKIKISREILLPVLQAANNVVERRQALPILSNLLFVASSNSIQVTATDMEVELVCNVENVVADKGSIALPARKLFDICRALPADAEMIIEGSGSKTKIASGRSRFSLSAMSADGFPSIGLFDASINLELSVQVLSDLLESTSFAMAHQDVRYYLNGLLLELDSGRIRAVSTDGHRLALTDKTVNIAIDTPRQCILPRKGVLEIVRLLHSSTGVAQIAVGENHFRVTVGGQSLTTKLVDGRFPEYERVIPRETDNRVIANRELLRAGLSRASILSNEKFRGIRLILKKNLLIAVAHNPEQEEAEEEMEVEYVGTAFEVGFNVSYLLDVLGVMRSDTVRIDLIDADSSCLMQVPEGDGSRYVVMPMRL
ncbi:MAG: DNA polymerase III subunit beta [Gammaproteobacteria bacterium]|nr:DNA polymerase III subunit beta [Gammaproteobacteria bacterium]